MDEKSGKTAQVSKIIRERALAILRDTRAKIDPTILAVMKERLSASSLVQTVKTTEASQVQKKQPPQVPQAPETEPVDKQKIAAIVLEYMKNRKDGQRH